MASDEYMEGYNGANSGQRLSRLSIKNISSDDVDANAVGQRLSRLSIKSISSDDVDANAVGQRLSRLSIKNISSDDVDAGAVGQRLSGLLIKNISSDGFDAGAIGEISVENNHVRTGIVSLPGTPEKRLPRRAAWDKEYDSDAEVGVRRSRAKGRDRWLERAWEMRGSREASVEPDGGCRLLVRPPGRDWSMRMDKDEVKACRDLGIELPSDWTVEIPYSATSSGGNSPVNSWRISSPGDDPNEVKARLKTWAQAVAFASTTSRLSV